MIGEPSNIPPWLRERWERDHGQLLRNPGNTRQSRIHGSPMIGDTTTAGGGTTVPPTAAGGGAANDDGGVAAATALFGGTTVPAAAGEEHLQWGLSTTTGSWVALQLLCRPARLQQAAAAAAVP